MGGDELARWEGGSPAGAGNGREERILVSVRLRPLNGREIERNDPSDWERINNTTVIFKNSVPERSLFPTAYSFDRVFGCECPTRQVYEEGAKEVALSVVSGINSSIFAYGQTSSGKTYTMTGITEYSMADIYNYIQKHTEREFLLKFSAMEIYNESVKDLLSTDSTPLRLLDDPEKGTTVEKLTEEILRDQNHLKELLSFCEAQRQIGETSLNEMSSRSHQILRLTIESSAREFLGRDNSSALAATVNFVDLAGSERASQALTAGARLKEGCHINRSLLTLGTVIRKLSKGRNGHVPYRDSKLTRILQHSLGGNARTAIICTMSPARSHIEQSRNTLLFASCAKEVATNAQVNVVMSDKALVKHLQRELARLESELKYPGLVSNSEALRERDSKINKMEKEMKELMQQRDLAQSRLEDLLRAVGDDRDSRQWDELSQFSITHEPVTCDDVFSISEASDFAYQIPDLDFTAFEQSNGGDNQDEHPFDNQKEDHSPSPRHSVSSSRSVELIPHHAIINDSDHCKEVRCIEVDESSTSRIDEFNPLLAKESDSLLPPAPDDNMHEYHEPEIKDEPVLDSKLQIPTKTVHDSELVASYPDESSPCSSVCYITSSRGPTLSRSNSCSAILMTSSDFRRLQVEQNNHTPPGSFLKETPKTAGEVRRRRLSAINYDVKIESCMDEGYPTSEQADPKDSIKPRNSEVTSEENILCNCVEGLKEMAHVQYQKELTNGQEIELKASEGFGDKGIIKDVNLDPIPNPPESPSLWPLEFEKKQKEIIELWHACNVSLFHRTCFFLLFKGDSADSIYMEVEHRRLSFLKGSFCVGNLEKPTLGDGHNTTLASCIKNLRREREVLRKQMQKRVSVKEREELYVKWGIALESKQRRLQLARRVWTETNMEHVRESASLVATLIGLLEPGQAFKEMFGLNFAPDLTNLRSHSRKPRVSAFK